LTAEFLPGAGRYADLDELTGEFLPESGRYADLDALSGEFLPESGRYADLDRPRSTFLPGRPTGVVGEASGLPAARGHEGEVPLAARSSVRRCGDRAPARASTGSRRPFDPADR
jgi:hypothetical protein